MKFYCSDCMKKQLQISLDTPDQGNIQDLIPYTLENGRLHKELQPPFCYLWEGVLPFAKGLESGIDKETLNRIIQEEGLNQIPESLRCTDPFMVL